tara:strand:+ start:39 stop:539 length:501 start_codon:yes stop_codon:yes gene_type:complete
MPLSEFLTIVLIDYHDSIQSMSKGRPSLSTKETVDLIRFQKYCCAVCKEELWIKYQDQDDNFRKERLAGIDSNNREELYRLPLNVLNLHHKLPRSAGGSGSENVEIVCEDCSETSQKSITLPNSIWKMLDDYNREIYADKGNIGMSRGRRLREIIMLHLHSLDSEE